MRTSLLVACAVVLGMTAFAARAEAQAPPHWKCSASWYGDGYWCDVGCGNYDVDCDASDSLWNGCPSAYPGSTYDATTATSSPKGDYTCGQKKLGVPSGWTCYDGWYDNDDGCDCACGEVDPDCADPGDTLYWCSAGQVCSPTGACTTAAEVRPTGTTNILHFGGMGSTHFEETSSSKLNSTAYKVRLGGPYNRVDAWVDQKTVPNVQSTYLQVKSYLDQYCTGGNSCWIYAYSAGGSIVQYAIAAHPNRASLNILGLRCTACADGGSDLASWGRLAEMVTAPMASTLTKSTQRALFDHNVLGYMGKTVYRSGGKGHSAWWPFSWSSAILWAGSAFCSGEDDGAVGLDSAGGCTSSAGRSDMNCTKFAGNVCATAGCPVYKLDHYEMKIKGLIEAGW